MSLTRPDPISSSSVCHHTASSLTRASHDRRKNQEGDHGHTETGAVKSGKFSLRCDVVVPPLTQNARRVWPKKNATIETHTVKGR